MNIGIELRQPVLGESGGVALLLRGMFKVLFDRHPDDQFTVFCTDSSRNLLPPAADHVRVQRLPTWNFFKHVDLIAKEQQIDVLFRSYPMDTGLAFPIEKQVFLIPDIQHELFPQFFTPEELRLRRKAFNQALASAGALGTLSEYARQTIRDHAWAGADALRVILGDRIAELVGLHLHLQAHRSMPTGVRPGRQIQTPPTPTWPSASVAGMM